MKRAATNQSVVSESGSQKVETAGLQTQILGNRYLNVEKLETLLKRKFGDNWKVQVSINGHSRQNTPYD